MITRHRFRRTAAVLLAIATSSSAFTSLQTKRRSSTTITTSSRHVSASTPASSSGDSGGEEQFYSSLDDILNSYEEAALQNDRVDRETERLLNKRREQLLARSAEAAQSAAATGCFRIQIPLATKATTTDDVMFGMTLVQVDPVRQEVSEEELDLDTMRITRSPNDEFPMDIPPALLLEKEKNNNKKLLLMVKSVVPHSPVEQAGVQVGDVVTAVSATMGGSVWPTSTLQGVQSAVSSRKLTSSASVTLELQRLAADSDTATKAAATAVAASAAKAANQFELTLTRPLGFQINEDGDGYVVVTGISQEASKLVQHGVQVGDRVVAVDALLGDQLWPVSTVEGVIAAVTSRLPRQTITMRFERPKANLGKALASVSVASAEEVVVVGKEKAEAPVMPVSPDKKELLKRCRDVLRRYAFEEDGSRATALQQVPAIVADKVVDALASASATLDAVTLSMIMNAYLTCDEPQSAIRIFEAATGFAGDGSTRPSKEVIAAKTGGGQILPTESALNLFTGTVLLQAHAAARDLDSVLRVLAALEGRSGVVDENGTLESAPWPWTGAYGSIQPDTQCYNIAMSATVKVRGPEALYRALELFDCMSDSKGSFQKTGPVRNAVTYNTLISVLCNAGRSEEAFAMFEQMKGAGLRPDKYTYTALIKACVHDGDVQELLFDMRERGVQADVVTYNTIIRSLCKKRQWTQATRLVTEMESRGISPNSKTYSYLMNGLLKTGKPSACITLFESACSDSRTVALTENVHLYTTAITAASVMGDHERALDFVSRMTANGVKPNLKTLTAVMGACLSSRKPDLAAQIYEKIDKPDGYAMSQGIRALCAKGDLSSAADIIESQQRGKRLMSGKDMMLSYKNILHAALCQKDYSMARRMISDLLAKGYIPNKAVLYAIVDSFELNRRASSLVQRSREDDHERFRFLLFLIDSLQRRNLPVEGILYVATLTLGSQLGGLQRTVASLMARVRSAVDAASKEIVAAKSKNQVEARLLDGWEEILVNYDSYAKEDLNVQKIASLPVRVSPKEIGRVLRAEQSVSYSARRKKQSPRKDR